MNTIAINQLNNVNYIRKLNDDIVIEIETEVDVSAYQFLLGKRNLENITMKIQLDPELYKSYLNLNGREFKVIEYTVDMQCGNFNIVSIKGIEIL